jgi:glycosyltransferase involved in cell wall biosynthesis
VVVGDGERRTALEAAARNLGLGERVHFLGWRGDLDRVYAGLDVVVLTSRNEGSPVALIEAMAAGRAVVSTDVGGVPDVVADRATGRLVPDNDAAAVATAVIELINDTDERARLGASARAHVAARYDAARLVADIDALYGRLLAEAGLRTV